MSETPHSNFSRSPAEIPAAFAHLAAGHLCGEGRYELKALAGRGGMGVVWQAEDLRLHEVVALKFLPAEIQHDALALQDMRRETLRSHRLSHPNIVRIHDLFESVAEAPFISMEFVDGTHLSKLRSQQPEKVFTWEYLQPLVRQLCDALEYAHDEGVIHRDLKPGNLMLDSKGRLKLADFGIAAVISDSSKRISHRHAQSGTPMYMSPQQTKGEGPQPVDDIYALGATLYELLTSRPPFYTGDISYQVEHVLPKPIDQRLAELGITNVVPVNVSALILACLGKERSERPQSIKALAAAFAAISAGDPATATFRSPQVEASFASATDANGAGALETETGARGPAKTWLTALACVLLVLGVGAMAWHMRHNASPDVTAAATNDDPADPVSEIKAPSPEDAAKNLPPPLPLAPSMTNSPAATNATTTAGMTNRAVASKQVASPTAAKAPAAPPSVVTFQNNDIIITGSGIQLAELNDRVRAFSNRPYLWEGVPAQVKGWYFIRFAGGERNSLKLRAKRDTQLVAILSTQDFPKVPRGGWKALTAKDSGFIYTDGKATPVYLAERPVAKDQEINVNIGNWMGVVVLFRK